MTDQRQSTKVGQPAQSELSESRSAADELGQLTSLLCIAAGQIESLATALENACEDQEGAHSDDPQGNQAVSDARTVAAQIQAKLAAYNEVSN